jgi:hypothetical protein
VVLGLIALEALRDLHPPPDPSPKHTTCTKYCLKIIIEGINYINQEKKSLTCI